MRCTSDPYAVYSLTQRFLYCCLRPGLKATVKSVREQGMMRTLGDAVEDAAGMVVGGAGSAISGMLSGKKGRWRRASEVIRPGEKTVSGHSGMSSGYADICAAQGLVEFL